MDYFQPKHQPLLYMMEFSYNVPNQLKQVKGFQLKQQLEYIVQKKGKLFLKKDNFQ